MAQKKFTELVAATALDGSEVAAIVQGGVSKKATAQDIADLASGLQSIVAGANITVDDTDPENPIISSSGGGGSQNLQSVLDEGSTATLDTNIEINLENGAIKSVTSVDDNNYGQLIVGSNSSSLSSSNNENT